jgi:hypothetical protein
MRKSPFKDRHNITQHIVILTLDDITQSAFIRVQLGWNYDFDVIMLN